MKLHAPTDKEFSKAKNHSNDSVAGLRLHTPIQQGVQHDKITESGAGQFRFITARHRASPAMPPMTDYR